MMEDYLDHEPEYEAVEHESEHEIHDHMPDDTVTLKDGSFRALLKQCVETAQAFRQDPENISKQEAFKSVLYLSCCKYFELNGVAVDEHPMIDQKIHGGGKRDGLGVIARIVNHVQGKPECTTGFFVTAFKNTFIDYKRTLKNDEHRPMQSLDAPIIGTDRTLKETLDVAPRKDDAFVSYAEIMQHVNKLNPRRKEILLQRANGASYSEISQKLDISMDSVKGSLWQARGQLIKSMQRAGHVDSYLTGLIDKDDVQKR